MQFVSTCPQKAPVPTVGFIPSGISACAQPKKFAVNPSRGALKIALTFISTDVEPTCTFIFAPKKTGEKNGRASVSLARLGKS
jgi:hypothetical protein